VRTHLRKHQCKETTTLTTALPVVCDFDCSENVHENGSTDVATCFKEHSHGFWARKKVAMALHSVRKAYFALVRRHNFSVDDMREPRSGELAADPSEDPMGTLVGAMTLVKWILTSPHLMQYSMGYETRCYCAASLYMTHKLKSEDSFAENWCVPMPVTVLGEFLDDKHFYTHPCKKQLQDIFDKEVDILQNNPVFSLTDHNVQSAAEETLSQLLHAEKITEEEADAALRRVFIYFYAAAMNCSEDVFETASRFMSTLQLGQAMARTVLRGTPGLVHTDALPLRVRLFSKRLVQCLEEAPERAPVDGDFLRAVRNIERVRVGAAATGATTTMFDGKKWCRNVDFGCRCV
jgi:hypothetical protein